MKVLPFKIPKIGGSNLILEEVRGNTFYGLLHQHEEQQLSYVLAGKGTLVLSDGLHPYAPGDVILIGGGLPHMFRSESDRTPSHMISLFFTDQSLGAGFFEIPEMEEVKSIMAVPGNVWKITSDLDVIRYKIKALVQASKFDRLVLFLQVLRRIALTKRRALLRIAKTSALSHMEGQRLQTVFDLAFNNFNREIALAEVAAAVHMTVPAFCRFFKKHTNKTFFEFLIAFRIANACKLLADNGNMTILEISEKSGFASISNFNRRFKSVKGVTPSAYKRLLKMQSGPYLSQKG